MADIGKGRAKQVCDYCLTVDDHPRHLIAGGTADVYPAPTAAAVRAVTAAVADLPEPEADRILNEFLDTGSLALHLDCCRERGCPTGECDQRTAGAENLRGAKLLTHLEKRAKEQQP